MYGQQLSVYKERRGDVCLSSTVCGQSVQRWPGNLEAGPHLLTLLGGHFTLLGPLYSAVATLFCWGPLYSAEGPLYSVGATLLC